MPVERREEALKQWNKARWLFPLKITFVVIKMLCHYAFYTTVRTSYWFTTCSQIRRSSSFLFLFAVTNTSETLEKCRAWSIMLFRMG
jgi:hypothetical protein